MKIKKSALKYIIAILVIAVLLIIIVCMKKDKNTVPVIMTSVSISKGTIITEENVDSLITVENIDADMKTENAISDKYQLIGKTVSCDVAAGIMISQEVIGDEANITAGMENPVVAGIRALDISQFSGGIIRAGDYIDISVVDSNTGKCSNVISNVYVIGAFNSDGTAIEDEGCAMILNVLIEKEREQCLNEMLAMGTVRVCRLERSVNE